MLNIQIVPDKQDIPLRGGVKRHIVDLYRTIERNDGVTISKNGGKLHVESSFPYPDNRDFLYVCHGGFVPPIESVAKNLNASKYVVSVAQWIIDNYFSEHALKTVVIPNGVILDDFENVPDSPITPGYILYGKEVPWGFENFVRIVIKYPDIRFVTVINEDEKGRKLNFPNVIYIGPQTRISMLSYIKNAFALLLTGSEVNPIMLLEAWALKTPVIGLGIDGTKETMLRNGRVYGGALYTTGHNSADYFDQSILQIVSYVLKNTKELGAEGRKIVEDHYDMDKLILEYMEVWKRI